MSQSNIAIVLELYQQFSRNNLAAAARLVSDDFEWQVVAFGQTLSGQEGFAAGFNSFAVPFPNAEVDIKKTIDCGDTVVVEYNFIATHSGAMVTPMGIVPPTGRRVDLPGCELYTLRDGKITHLHTYFDAATMMQQLGLMPQSDAA